MLEKKKIWQYRQVNKEKVAVLAKSLGLSPITACLCLHRGADTPLKARKFLYPSLDDLSDPFILTGMNEAVTRILTALNQREKILIYGDYDTDGITSTALLSSLLQDLGAQVSFHIPNRFSEGYGLNKQALEKAATDGVSLIITVDCGENAVSEIMLAQEKGIDIVVTDHHQPQGEVTALAHINPHRETSDCPCKDLAGVGVAFKLAQALLSKTGQKENGAKYLDLVALGTVADIVPLLGENRILVKYGLEVINKRERLGLKALLEVAGLEGRSIDAGHIGFYLAPRLNAAGRMGEAWPGVKLLLTTCAPVAQEVANYLNEENTRRQKVDREIFKEAYARVTEDILHNNPVLILEAEGWHEGVLGIVASRLLETFSRPVILLSIDSAQKAKGSGRSVPGFDLVAALRKADIFLSKYGGHALAAGLSLPKENIPSLRKLLNSLAKEDMDAEKKVSKIYLDAQIKGKDLTFSLVEEISLLAPFGLANPRPLLGGNFYVNKKRKIGKNGKHLKLSVENEGLNFSALYFSNGNQEEKPLCYQQLGLAFYPEINLWQGKKEISLIVKDMDFADLMSEKTFSLVDQRGITAKMSYLQELLNYTSENVIVYVNTRTEKESLSANLETTKIVFLHQGKKLPTGFRGEGGHLVLWSLPFHREGLLALMANLQGEKNQPLKVHLLFGDTDYNHNLRLFEAAFPRQKSLQKLWLGIQHFKMKKPYNLKKLQEYVSSELSSPVTYFLIERGLPILENARFLAEKEVAAGVSDTNDFSLKKLSAIPTFQQDTKLLADYQVFQKQLLDNDRRKLLPVFLNCGTNSENVF